MKEGAIKLPLNLIKISIIFFLCVLCLSYAGYFVENIGLSTEV